MYGRAWATGQSCSVARKGLRKGVEQKLTIVGSRPESEI